MRAGRETPLSGAQERRLSSLRRIPSLDGLRAISIFLVVALHTLQRYSLHHVVSYPWRAVFNGGLGVSIFFVISGYLITSLLLKEYEGTGSVSLRGFFLKRAFRILPPIVFYLAVLIVLASIGRLTLYTRDVVSALLFFHDYRPFAKSWALEHFWSLSVEEQFYLVWPFLLLFCLRRRVVHGRRYAARVAFAVIAISPAVRLLALLSHNPYLHNASGFHMHADMLAFGCLAALLQGTGRFERVYGAVTRVAWLPPLLLLVSSYLDVRLENRWTGPAGETIDGFLITFFLLWCTRNANTLFGRLLNAAPIVRLGVLSYSIYLWQTLFLHSSNRETFRGAEWVGRPPWNWIAILIVAEISYYGVEKPWLRMRNALLRRVNLHRAAVPEGRSHIEPIASTKLGDRTP